MSNPAVWFEIYVQDMARAKAFYETVFNVKLARLENPDLEMWGFPSDMNSYGSCGSLVQMPGMPSGGNSTIVYFHCEDCAVEAAKAAKAGGKLFKEKFSIGQYGAIALVYDTEGNMIGLHSMG
jgi:predicted enzyme related to lactoylglutathione lyase